MQSHRARDYLSVGRTTKVNFDPFTAAAMCRGVQRKHYLAARVHYCLDLSGIRQLEKWLMSVAQDFEKQEKWRVPKGRNYLTNMCLLAIIEAHGSQDMKFAKQKAEWVGVSESQWNRVWQTRYEAIYLRLMGWVDIATRQIIKNQYGSS